MVKIAKRQELIPHLLEKYPMLEADILKFKFEYFDPYPTIRLVRIRPNGLDSWHDRSGIEGCEHWLDIDELVSSNKHWNANWYLVEEKIDLTDEEKKRIYKATTSLRENTKRS